MSLCLAKVWATNRGKIIEAQPKILAALDTILSLPQVRASLTLAPESDPSSYRPVLMNTPQSAPFLQIWAFRMWCFGILPPMTRAQDFLAFMPNLLMSLISSTTSILRSCLKELVKSMSPIAPSVIPGQKTGMLFLQHQQQMLEGLLISFPKRLISLEGVHSVFLSLDILAKIGSKKFSSLMQFSAGTKMLPILQFSSFLFCRSSMLYSARWNSLMHFIKSSSIPPVVVTMQSIILCSARYRMMSLLPQEAMFEVYPRKMVALTFFRNSGSFSSSSSSPVSGSSLSLQRMTSLRMSTALEK